MSVGVVRVDGLVRSFAGVRAVDGIRFDVLRGEMFGLIGPDGAGKTTTLRSVLGLLSPDAGRVTTCGLDPFADRRRLSAHVGYLAQRFSLYGDLSVDENVAFLARVHRVRGWRARRDALLSRLQLTPFRARLADRLSGGMRQKLALACTLVHTPELLVLDEPTTGIDPVSRRELWKILRELQSEGLTILLTTPYLDEAERCDRVGLIDRGRLLDVRPPRDLQASLAGTMIEVLARPLGPARERLASRPGIADVQSFGGRLHAFLPGVDARDAARVASEIAAELAEAGLAVEGARPIEPTLEDVFIARLQSPSPGGSAEVAS